MIRPTKSTKAHVACQTIRSAVVMKKTVYSTKTGEIIDADRPQCRPRSVMDMVMHGEKEILALHDIINYATFTLNSMLCVQPNTYSLLIHGPQGLSDEEIEEMVQSIGF